MLSKKEKEALQKVVPGGKLIDKRTENYIREQRSKAITPPCTHPHLVPLEVSFIRITHPNGYKEQPKCEFYVSISLATAFRVRKYFCPECKEIIKAPSIYAEENV